MRYKRASEKGRDTKYLVQFRFVTFDKLTNDCRFPSTVITRGVALKKEEEEIYIKKNEILQGRWEKKVEKRKKKKKQDNKVEELFKNKKKTHKDLEK